MKLHRVILAALVADCTSVAGLMPPKTYTPPAADLQELHNSFNIEFAGSGLELLHIVTRPQNQSATPLENLMSFTNAFTAGPADQPAFFARDITYTTCFPAQTPLISVAGELRAFAKNFCKYLETAVFARQDTSAAFIFDNWLCTYHGKATKCTAWVGIQAPRGVGLSTVDFKKKCPIWLGTIDDKCPRGGVAWDYTNLFGVFAGYSPLPLACLNSLDECTVSQNPPPT